MNPLRRLLADDAGLSLVESLLAVIIMAISFGAIIGGFATGILGSELHRGHSTGETEIRRLAEHIKGRPYEDCAAPSTYTTGTNEFTPTNSTFDVSISYWNGVDFGNCPVVDLGLQKISLTVTPTSANDVPATREILEIIKRRD